MVHPAGLIGPSPTSRSPSCYEHLSLGVWPPAPWLQGAWHVGRGVFAFPSYQHLSVKGMLMKDGAGPGREMLQATGHRQIVPQSSDVLEHPSGVGKGAGECSSLARGQRIGVLQGVVWQGELPAITRCWCSQLPADCGWKDCSPQPQLFFPHSKARSAQLPPVWESFLLLCSVSDELSCVRSQPAWRQAGWLAS